MIGTKARLWFAARFPVSWPDIKLHMHEEVPVAMRSFIYALGGTPLILFIIMIVTGLMLTFYYVPSLEHAYHSVERISYGIRYGWLVRGIHATASNLLIVALLLHMARVYVTHAYRKPRELTWITGSMIFFCMLGAAFTGYSLVYDQLSYWATTVGTSFLNSIPLVGEPLLVLIRGSDEVSSNTLTRFYTLHISLLPALLVGMIVIHIILVRLHGIAVPEKDSRREVYGFFPEHILKEGIIALALLAAIILWVSAYPPVLGPPADFENTPDHIRPEWYFYAVFRWLKIVPLTIGVWGMLFFVGGCVMWPLIGDGLDRIGQRYLGIRLGFYMGLTAFLSTLVLLIIEAVAHA